MNLAEPDIILFKHKFINLIKLVLSVKRDFITLTLVYEKQVSHVLLKNEIFIINIFLLFCIIILMLN